MPSRHAKMPLLFPSQDILHDIFHPSIPFGRSSPSLHNPKEIPIMHTPLEARTELYPTWSVVDDAKSKAKALSAEAQVEFDKASAKAQAKAGHIELYTAKYYAACTFGGLLACVSIMLNYDDTVSRRLIISRDLLILP
jgi:solute carrier family 25 phosphate transporter 3